MLLQADYPLQPFRRRGGKEALLGSLGVSDNVSVYMATDNSVSKACVLLMAFVS
jgi:hypothetical protein